MKNIVNYLLFWILFCFCNFPLSAQKSGAGTYQYNPTTDSLIKILKKSAQLPDTTKINTLSQLGQELYQFNPDTSIIIFKEALEIAQKANLPEKEAELDDLLGTAFFYLKENYALALKYQFKALSLWEQLSNASGNNKQIDMKYIATLRNIGEIFLMKFYLVQNKEELKKAEKYYLMALDIAEKINDPEAIVGIYNNLGSVYSSIENHAKALEYYEKALALKQKLKLDDEIAYVYTNMGIAYMNMGNYSKALENHFISLKIEDQMGDTFSTAGSLWNVANVYVEQKKYPEALDYYFKSLPIWEKAGDYYNTAHLFVKIAETYTRKKEYKKAEEYLQKALKIAESHSLPSVVIMAEKTLSDLYTEMKAPAKALEHYKKYIVIRDSTENQENSRKIAEYDLNFEFERKQQEQKALQDKKDTLAAAALQQNKLQRNFFLGGLTLVLLFSLFMYRQYRLKQKANLELSGQKQIIEEKNKDITDSIDYARVIQRAMLPHRKDIWNAFSNSFVLFKPKDIVSGDFYFFAPVTHSTEKESYFIAAADCTGHGVPGALMSMLSIEKLNAAIAISSDISEIMTMLNKGIKTSLRQSENDRSTRDGMDIALVRIDKMPESNATLYYSGANRPIWIVRKGTNTIEEIKATRKGIGGFTEENQHFSVHTIELLRGDTFYIFSDGYADMFGHNGEKLMTSRLKEILLNIQDKTLKEQGLHLDEFAENWKGKKEQIDDILVIGVRV